MRTITISGHSDDIVSYSILETLECDEFGALSDNDYVGYLEIKSGNEYMKIHCIYDGNWSFAIPKDEEAESLPWEVERSYKRYSEVLKLTRDTENLKIEFRRNGDD